MSSPGRASRRRRAEASVDASPEADRGRVAPGGTMANAGGRRKARRAQARPSGRAITLLPGDGIGPEITRAVVRILEAAGFRPRWDEVLAGEAAEKEFGDPLPASVLDSIERNRVALKGPLRT